VVGLAIYGFGGGAQTKMFDGYGRDNSGLDPKIMVGLGGSTVSNILHKMLKTVFFFFFFFAPKCDKK